MWHQRFSTCTAVMLPQRYYIVLQNMCALLVGMTITLLAHHAVSAPVSAEEMRDELQRAYQQVLMHPDDYNTNMKYASIAVKMEDYESAIPPLERTLMADPDNSKIKLRIGMMFYLLGSNSMAKVYFNDVAIDANAAPEIVAEAQQYLGKM